MEKQTEVTTLGRQEHQHYFEKGISYSRYLSNMISEVESGVESEKSHYIPLNLQRSQRIAKTVQLTDTIKAEIKSLHHKISWLVISEHWCGDSAQSLPVMNAIAEASNGLIDLRIVYRDENPELIDAHLTNGGRAIPKLIQMDRNYSMTGTWGPRPNEAQRLVKELKSNPETAASYNEKLHKWYADDKTAAIQRDIAKLLKMAVAFCPDCMAG
jgi:hypothetical protein